MRHAFRGLALAVLVTAACAAVASAIQITYVNRINAIGIIDYSKPPTFKVGDYVRYQVTNGVIGSTRSDYQLTVLIAGEEEFWGEKCFWVETWTDESNGTSETAASLMSYDIFGDSLADERLQSYRRKLIHGADENGQPVEEITRGTTNLTTARTDPGHPSSFQVDTLGIDTLITPVGLFNGRRVHTLSGKHTTETLGDSSIYRETREERTRWLDASVPITRIVREETRNSSARRAWKVGYSSENSPLIVKDTGAAMVRLVEKGHGLKARILPASRATTFAQQAAARRAASRKPAATTARR